MNFLRPDGVAYLNHARTGFTPYVLPVDDDYDELVRLRAELRPLCSQYLGCQPEEWAIVSSTSTAAATVILGIDWKPGDEVVKTNLDHPCIDLPVREVERRFGLTVHDLDIGVGEKQEVYKAFLPRLNEQTRLCVLTSIAPITGARLPAGQLMFAIRDHSPNAYILVDAAQEMLLRPNYFMRDDPIFDALCTTPAKWLGGEKGLGLLWVRKKIQPQIEPLVSNLFGHELEPALRGEYRPLDDARKYEFENLSIAALSRWKATFETIGPRLPDFATTAWQLARIFIQEIRFIRGIEVITPEDRWQIVSIRIENRSALEVQRELKERGVEVAAFERFNAVRFCFHWANTEEDLTRAIKALRAIVDG